MPYGIPWGMVAFRCISCGREHSYDVYRQYCSLCGTKQPDESELKSLGLIVYSSASDTPASTHDLEEMNVFLQTHRGKPMALWTYSVSHSELEIRLTHSGGPNQTDEPWLNTMIFCSATESILLPNLRWACNLIIEVKHNVRETPNGPFSLDYYVLVDDPANIRIQCRSVGMYFDIKPGL
jgi:hypothetical protein